MVFENSKYIWGEGLGQNSFLESYLPLEYKTGKCILNFSCDGDYTLFINGKYVSSNQYGDYEHYKSYDEIDITDYLTVGKNHLAFLIWHFGNDTQRYKKYSPGFIFEVINDGKVILASNEDTLVRQSKAYESGFNRLISSQLGFSYKYDSTKEDKWLFGLGDSFKKSFHVDKKSTFVKRPNKKLSLGSLIRGNVIYKDERNFVCCMGCERFI